jgi:LSD1 subclass zinc finger protein
MFSVNCANCNELLRLPDDAAGKSIRCLKCQAAIHLPVNPVKTSGYSSGVLMREFVEKKKRRRPATPPKDSSQ